MHQQGPISDPGCGAALIKRERDAEDESDALKRGEEEQLCKEPNTSKRAHRNSSGVEERRGEGLRGREEEEERKNDGGEQRMREEMGGGE